MSETPIYDLLVSVHVTTRPLATEVRRTAEAAAPEAVAGRGAHRIPQPRSPGRHHRGA
jgi:hypothetical protein